MTDEDRKDLQSLADYHREKRVEHSRLSSRTDDFHDGRSKFHERLRLAAERILAETVLQASGNRHE